MLRLNFTGDNKYTIYRSAYAAIWSVYGFKIIKAFEYFCRIPFKENKVDAVVGTGDRSGSNFSGNKVSDPMLFRYSVRDKLGTIFHEMGHRLIMEYNYFELSKNILKIKQDHQFLDLFLYDVISQVLGKEAAEERMLYESAFPESMYRESWDWAMSYDFESRQRMLETCSKLIR